MVIIRDDNEILVIILTLKIINTLIMLIVVALFDLHVYDLKENQRLKNYK
jgi:hypothetical protein